MADDIFKIGDADLGNDMLEATAYGDAITVTIEEPWAGDTETGFGRSCSLRIGKNSARELANWLLAHC